MIFSVSHLLTIHKDTWPQNPDISIIDEKSLFYGHLDNRQQLLRAALVASMEKSISPFLKVVEIFKSYSECKKNMNMFGHFCNESIGE